MVNIVGNPINREEGRQRTVTKSHEQLNKEKKERTQVLTRHSNLPTSSGQGERILIESINYRLQVPGYKYWGYYPSLYSQRNHEEKKTKNT